MEGGREEGREGGGGLPWVEIGGREEQADGDEIERERYVRVRRREGGKEGGRKEQVEQRP